METGLFIFLALLAVAFIAICAAYGRKWTQGRRNNRRDPSSGRESARRFPIPEFAAACVGVIGAGTLQFQPDGAFTRIYAVAWIILIALLFVWSVVRAVRHFSHQKVARCAQVVLYFAGLTMLLVWAQTAYAISTVVIAAGALTYAFLTYRYFNAAKETPHV